MSSLFLCRFHHLVKATCNSLPKSCLQELYPSSEAKSAMHSSPTFHSGSNFKRKLKRQSLQKVLQKPRTCNAATYCK